MVFWFCNLIFALVACVVSAQIIMHYIWFFLLLAAVVVAAYFAWKKLHKKS